MSTYFGPPVGSDVIRYGLREQKPQEKNPLVDAVIEAMSSLPVFLWMQNAMTQKRTQRAVPSTKARPKPKPRRLTDACPESPGSEPLKLQAASASDPERTPRLPKDEYGNYDLPPLHSPGASSTKLTTKEYAEQAVRNCERARRMGKYVDFEYELEQVKRTGEVHPKPKPVKYSRNYLNAVERSELIRRDRLKHGPVS